VNAFPSRSRGGAALPSVRIERFHTPHAAAGRRGRRPELIVVHTTAGTFDGTVDWFSRPESKVSAHYLVGLSGRVAAFVDEADVARHAGRVLDPLVPLPDGDPNLFSIGIEFEDDRDPEGVIRPDDQYRSGAGLIRAAAERWAIPLDRGHVVGHREIFAEKRCPGNLDVDRLVREALR
jgi:N-acetyl-anhydromuramyl-L-alanine amidase AmpD